LETLLIERVLWPFADEEDRIVKTSVLAHLTSRDHSLGDFYSDGMVTSLIDGVVTYWFKGERICETNEHEGTVTVWAGGVDFGDEEEIEELY
jgi:hypothetical protein